MSEKKIDNDLFLRAAKGEIVERPPVWLMRQAGRVLPEYRATRSKAKNFIAFVKNPELAAEVTIQPVDILGVDAAIIFSDILVIPEAMGLPYQMIESKGPWFENTIISLADVERLHICDGSELKYVTDAITLAKQQLNNRVPLIGFAGAPFTILAYMVEGSGSKTFSKAKAFLYQQPAAAHLLLEKIALSTIQYLKAQIAAGADLIQLFDSWAGVLSPNMYSEFSLKYISMICDAITEVPKTAFAKGANFALSEMSHLNCEVLGLDWNIQPADARALVGNKVLQGNADPCLLYANEEKIVTETHAMLKAFGKQKYIANLGHGLYPDIEKEKVKLYVDTIKNYKYN
jgi:uroporphyrinogen decarboxylase